MSLSFRLSALLVAGLAAISLGFAWNQASAEREALERELEHQAFDLAESQVHMAAPLLAAHEDAKLQQLVQRFQHRERVAGVAIWDSARQPVAITPDLAERLAADPSFQPHPALPDESDARFIELGGVPMQMVAMPLIMGDAVIGTLAVFHHAGYIGAQITEIWLQALGTLGLEALLVVPVTILLVRRGVHRPLERTARWMRDLRSGKSTADSNPPANLGPDLKPLTSEIAKLAASLTAARAAAEIEARLRDTAASHWTRDRLRVFVQDRLAGSRLVAVSNREPYEHFYKPSGIECSVPASGLVTALEPILRACNGTWIAQGTGDADRETSDAQGRLRVPPDNPHYTLRRLWLSEEETQGFYLGFANEGLWPLCHIAHTRPSFRSEDWEQYEAVNRKFADAVLAEIEGEENPLVVVQDYHFALMPRMVKKARPDSRVAIFWHIPWPNPESFSICPWQRELLDGLLGADLIGFHIQSHCNNFLDTVDRVLESRIERERDTVSRLGHLSRVRRFPISVAIDPERPTAARPETPDLERSRLLAQHGVRASLMGVGVDRVDYTKGIPERFRGLERFFEKYPAYRGQFTFVQIGAPSRSEIRRYHDLMLEIEEQAARINARFQTGDWKPIVLLTRRHSHDEIQPYYHTADVCMVTSLHDGMNLVAKEYVAARSDDDGTLVLSRFTGACHELVDALVVNPYDTEEVADAIYQALDMGPEERTARMCRMRAVVREHNIYRWAADLISELCEIRTEESPNSAHPELAQAARK